MILCIQGSLINLYAEPDIPKLHVKVFVKMPKRGGFAKCLCGKGYD